MLQKGRNRVGKELASVQEGGGLFTSCDIRAGRRDRRPWPR